MTVYATPAQSRARKARHTLDHFGGNVDLARAALACLFPGTAPAYLDKALRDAGNL